MLAALRRGAAAHCSGLPHAVADALPAAALPLVGSSAAAAAAVGSRSWTCRTRSQPYSAAAGGSNAEANSGQHFVIASSTPVTKRLWQR